MDTRSVLEEILQCHRVLAGHGDSPPAPPSRAPGCTEAEIFELEARLGTELPPSYRSFLQVMNGCPQLDAEHGGLLPAAAVDWFRVNNTKWIAAYTNSVEDELFEKEHRVYGPDQDTTRFRRAYLPELLQIGEVYAGTVYLLNPCVRNAEGEWEAWDFCNHYPGAAREPSFAMLLKSIRNDLQRDVRMASAEFDEDLILKKSVDELRCVVGEDGEPDPALVLNYVVKKIQADDSFAAWASRVHAPSALFKALRDRPS